MAIPADKVATPPVLTDDDGPRKKWVDQAARTTAVLAVLAAISSGQYANQFSHTILAQAEASDEWGYYQAKSIKRHLVNGQAELAAALEATKTGSAEKLEGWRQQSAAETKRYDAELAQIKSKAEVIEAKKIHHGQQGFWFQIAFAVLQAGVVLSTIAASSRRRELWVVAILCGVLGAVIAANGVLLVVPAPAGI
jgi:hypothetical protein